jgi:azurin
VTKKEMNELNSVVATAAEWLGLVNDGMMKHLQKDYPKEMNSTKALVIQAGIIGGAATILAGLANGLEETYKQMEDSQ